MNLTIGLCLILLVEIAFAQGSAGFLQDDPNIGDFKRLQVDRNNRRQDAKNLDALIRLKHLLKPDSRLVMKGMDPKTVPTLITPVNYYDANWTLTKSNRTTSNYLSFKGNKIAITLPSSKETTLADVVGVNFDSMAKTVQSVDVMVETKGRKKSARLPISVPAPRSVRIRFAPSDTNNWRWVTDGSKLSVLAGNYKFEVYASGIVYDATMSINGIHEGDLGGFDPNTGRISHNAVSDNSANQLIGSIVKSIGGETKQECTYSPIDKTYDISITVNSPELGKLANSRFTLKVHDGFNLPNLSVDQAARVCQEECPNDSFPVHADKSFSIGKNAPVDSHPLMFWGDAQNPNSAYYENGWGRFKLCASWYKPIWSYYDKNQTLPVSKGVAGHYEEIEMFALVPETCEKRFIMERGDCGCFDNQTMITMGDGVTQKAISKIKKGDLVWNPVTKRAMPIKRMTVGPELKPLLEIKTKSSSVQVTGKHPFKIKEGLLLMAFELKEGDLVQTKNGKWEHVEAISSIHKKSENNDVWNIEVDGGFAEENHYLLADGIVTGDYLLQTQLEMNDAVTER